MPKIQSLKGKTKDLNDKIKVIIYGPAGAGKTKLAGTFPKPLFFDFDNKLASLYGTDIDYIPYPLLKLGDATSLFFQFKQEWDKQRLGSDYETLVLDSLTLFDTLNLRHFVLAAGKKASEKATLPVYGDQSGFYQSFFAQIIGNRDKNIVILAHEHYNIDPDSETHSVQPMVTGKSILNKLPAMFPELWYLESTKNGRTLHPKAKKRHVANSILLANSEPITDPTYAKIMESAKRNP